MTGLACLFGIHSSLERASFTSIDDRGFVMVTRVRCSRCHAPIAEEVVPVAELPESDD